MNDNDENNNDIEMARHLSNNILNSKLPEKYNPDNFTDLSIDIEMPKNMMGTNRDSDYIYGTNYQFCHGYISKDLGDMTQEKTIQAMGRIGRNHLHKNYSIRFRHDDLIEKIFTHS